MFSPPDSGHGSQSAIDQSSAQDILMNYSYRLMVQENEDNHILKCQRLFHKEAVDIYVIVGTE